MKRCQIMVIVTVSCLHACTRHADSLDGELTQEEPSEDDGSPNANVNSAEMDNEAGMEPESPVDFNSMVKELLSANNMSEMPKPASSVAETPPAAAAAETPPTAAETAVPSAVAASPSPTASSSPATAESRWVFVPNAWVHAAPSVEAQRTERLAYGTKVSMVSEMPDWIQIGEQRFVRRQDLTDRKARFEPHGGGAVAYTKSSKSYPKALPAYSSSTLAQGSRRVKSEVLAIRKQPQLEAPIVGYLQGNSDVTIVAQGWNGWTQIGPQRFVRTKYLFAPSREVLGSGQETFTVASEALYIRTEPDHHATIVGVLLAGDEIRADAISDRWVQIDARRYVRRKHLTHATAH